MAATVTIPQSPEELREMLAEKSFVQNNFKTPDQIAEFTQSYAEKFAAKDKGDVIQQTKEQQALEFFNMLRDADKEGFGPSNKIDFSKHEKRGGVGDVSAFIAARHKGTKYNAVAPGAQVDRDMKLDPISWLNTIYHGYEGLPGAEAWEANRTKLNKFRNSLGSDIPSDGGFIMPESFRSDIWSLALEEGIVRPYATVIPMTTKTLLMPSVDSTSNQTSLFGGFVAYWTPEGSALTKSSPKFGQTELTAKKLTIYTEVPNELPQDANALVAFLGQQLPKVISFTEDDGFTNGNGVGEPLGWLNCDAMVVADHTNDPTTATNISWVDIISMYARMLPSSIRNARWKASIDTLPQLALAANAAGYPMWLTNGVNGPEATLLGRPIDWTEKVNSVGEEGDLSLVDMSYYIIGDRQTVTAASSTESKFGEDKTAYKVIERVDGKPWMSSPVTPKNGGATLSPFVTLEART